MQNIQYPGHLISRTGHRIQVVLQPQRLQLGGIGRLVGERRDVALLRKVESFAFPQRVYVVRKRHKIHKTDSSFPDDDQSCALGTAILVSECCGVNIGAIAECFPVVPLPAGDLVVMDVAREPEIAIGKQCAAILVGKDSIYNDKLLRKGCASTYKKNDQ